MRSTCEVSAIGAWTRLDLDSLRSRRRLKSDSSLAVTKRSQTGDSRALTSFNGRVRAVEEERTGPEDEQCGEGTEDAAPEARRRLQQMLRVANHDREDGDEAADSKEGADETDQTEYVGVDERLDTSVRDARRLLAIGVEVSTADASSSLAQQRDSAAKVAQVLGLDRDDDDDEQASTGQPEREQDEDPVGESHGCRIELIDEREDGCETGLIESGTAGSELVESVSKFSIGRQRRIESDDCAGNRQRDGGAGDEEEAAEDSCVLRGQRSVITSAR